MRHTIFMLGLLLMMASQVHADALTLKKGVDAFGQKDYAQASVIFKRLSNKGDRIAQFGLAKMYRYGLGMDPNYSKALKWYLQAAQQNYAVAMSHLGEMYEQGLGVDANADAARNWYRMACSNRCSDGCLHLKRLDKVATK